MSDRMMAWTIYDRPIDFPESVVARRWFIGAGQLEPGMAIVGPSVEAVRELIPPGFVCVGREPDDEPHVVETWL